MVIDAEKIRSDFPALQQEVNGSSLVYLDSAASALKPAKVVKRLSDFYAYEASNVHRGVHSLSAKATDHFEAARKTIQKFINASSDREIVFTKGTTDSVNLVAHSWGRRFLEPGDEVILSEMEHHSNIVPWQLLVEERKIKIQFVNVKDNGELDLEHFEKLLSTKTKMVAISHCSNTLGTINPVEEIIEKAHQVGAKVLIDAAQSVTNIPVDVQRMNCDFLVFSGHKLYGPYGIGCLYGKSEALEEMPPYQGGGSMILEVSTEGSTYNEIPFRFEAGTPHIAGAMGLAAAIDYLQEIGGMQSIAEHEFSLQPEMLKSLKSISGLKLVGEAEKRANIFSFAVDGIHANDIGDILNQGGVAVRTGHHCTQPLMKRMGVTSTVRASFTIYNNMEDLERLCSGIEKAKDLLG